jgi:hypothetical protein
MKLLPIHLFLGNQLVLTHISSWSPILVGVALDLLGNWVVQLFCRTVPVPDYNQNYGMNACRSTYSVIVINQPKKIITISIRYVDNI